MKKGFQEFEVEVVFAQTMKANLGSQKVMKKLGMTLVREFLDSEFVGTRELDVEYSIRKEDWTDQD